MEIFPEWTPVLIVVGVVVALVAVAVIDRRKRDRNDGPNGPPED